MDSAEIIERERQWGRTAGILGIIGVLCVLLPAFIGLGSDFNTLERDAFAERFEVFDETRGEVFAAQVLQAIGMLLFAPPLLFLFQAAMNRSPETVRRPLMGLTVIGPVLFAIALILFYVAYDAATPTFLDNAPAGGDIEQFAEDTLTEEGTYSAYLGLQLAAAISLVVAVVYTSLQAMRVGLLTRFLGTLGMALGIGFLLFGPLGPLALGLYVITISLLIADFWRGQRPPAWETGEAVPWPKPGQEPPPGEEELARPEDFEGSARELDEEEDSAGEGDAGEGDAAEDDSAGAPDADTEPTRPGRRDNKRKRKRKQRG